MPLGERHEGDEGTDAVTRMKEKKISSLLCTGHTASIKKLNKVAGVTDIKIERSLCTKAVHT